MKPNGLGLLVSVDRGRSRILREGAKQGRAPPPSGLLDPPCLSTASADWYVRHVRGNLTGAAQHHLSLLAGGTLGGGL